MQCTEGDVAEWSERFGNGAVGRGIEPGIDQLATGTFYHTSIKGYLFKSGDCQGSERGGMGIAFHMLCPRYSEHLISDHIATWLWEPFIF